MKIKFIPVDQERRESQIVSSTKVLRFFCENPNISKEMEGRVILGQYAHSVGGPMPLSIYRSLEFSRQRNCWKRSHEGFATRRETERLKERDAVWAIKDE